MKKRTAIITAIVLLSMITIFAVISRQRHNDDPLLELSTHHYTWSPRITFIVEHNRTFISYYRLRPSGAYEDREEVILTEQEFQHISELLDVVIGYYTDHRWRPKENVSGVQFSLWHNGFKYKEVSNVVPGALFHLEDELRRLSPMRFPR